MSEPVKVSIHALVSGWFAANRHWRRRAQIKHAKFNLRVARAVKDKPAEVFWQLTLRRVDYDAEDKVRVQPRPQRAEVIAPAQLGGSIWTEGGSEHLRGQD